MPTMTVDAKVIKHIFDGVYSKSMEAEGVTMRIYENRILVRQTDPSMSAMFSLLSEPIEWNGGEVDITLSLNDMKTLAKLSTDCKITIELGDGAITCKIGKVTKKFPLIAESKFVENNPKPKLPYRFSVSDDLIKSIKDAFSDMNEGTVEITTTPETIKMSVRDIMTVRNTEILIVKEDCKLWECPGNITTAFRIEIFGPMLKLKVDGSEAVMEFDDKKPISFIQSVENCYKSKILLAPVRFQDDVS